jgi:hypothetical protein
MTPSTGPSSVAHWVVKTARTREMIDWYGLVLGAHVVRVAPHQGD